MRSSGKSVAAFAGLMLVTVALSAVSGQDRSSAIETIAEDAFTFAFPMLEQYRSMLDGVTDPLTGNVALNRFNQFIHREQLADASSRFVVRPNNDTLYSLGWLDLRAEPVVIHAPPIPRERYWSIQIVDAYTHNAAIFGVWANWKSAKRASRLPDSGSLLGGTRLRRHHVNREAREPVRAGLCARRGVRRKRRLKCPTLARAVQCQAASRGDATGFASVPDSCSLSSVRRTASERGRIRRVLQFSTITGPAAFQRRRAHQAMGAHWSWCRCAPCSHPRRASRTN